MFGSRLLDTSPSRRGALSSLLGVSGRYAATPTHLPDMDGVGTSESAPGNYVSLAELAAELRVSVQTIYDLRSKGRGPRGFRVGTQLRFRKTPELASPDSIGLDPLPPGQVWAISEGSGDVGPGLYRIEAADTPGSGARGLLNQAAPATLRESFKVAEQNLIAQARQLVGDRDPREHNLTAQVRALDAAKTGAGLGLPILLAMASAMLQRSVRGGLIAVGNLSLGGGVETVLNAAQLAEHAMEKGATALLLPVSARRQLLDVSDEVATKVSFIFYSDAQDALVKALDE